MTKKEHMQAIDAAIARGEAIIAAGVGSGITAKAAEEGGADIILTYNTAVYRIQGIPTAMAFLPYDDCNALAFSVAPQVMAAVRHKPVMIGLGAHDPRRNIRALVQEAKAMGFSGVTNEPFIGIYSGDVRRQVEAVGLGFVKEIELIKAAGEAGMMTVAYVFTPEEAVQMAEAGADFIGAMVGGVTSGGSAGGAATVDLHEAIETINAIVSAIEGTGKKVPVLVHGGPLNDVAPVAQVLEATPAKGYITGSTGERLPVESAVKQKISDFKSLRREVR